MGFLSVEDSFLEEETLELRGQAHEEQEAAAASLNVISISLLLLLGLGLIYFSASVLQLPQKWA